MEQQHTLVRSSDSGVWIAESAEILDLTGTGTTVRLHGAIRIWAWEGALACATLALTGPTGGTVEGPVDVIVAGCCEVIVATPAAYAAARALL